MTGTPITVLIVEDNPADARLMREMLDEATGAAFAVLHATRLADAVARLADETVEVVLLALSLPDAHGLDAIVRLHSVAPRVPIVVMSGVSDPALAVAGVREGAQDYLVKGQVKSDDLVRALRHAIERRRVDDRLSHLAHHDTLTDLPNRTLLHDRLRQSLAHARRHDLPLGLLHVDLDGFNETNDTLGRDGGDVLLREVARRLKSCVREGDTVARFGGDEFAVILPDIKQDTDAAIVARRMLALLATPFSIGERDLRVTASIGIGLYPTGGDDTDSLLKSAGAAMYRAKEEGGNGFAFFTPDMTSRAHERFSLERGITRAIEQGELLLHYQPIVAVATQGVCRVEALVRWSHPDQGLILPGGFLGVAEQTGLIGPLTRWVLRTVLRQCQTWDRDGLRLDVAVNLSPRSLQDPDLPATIARLLPDYGVAPARLTLEVAEGTLMTDPRAVAALERLAALGVRVAIDDFGTGFSSLGHLKDLPIDEVKIDRSLVQGMGANVKDGAIVCSIIGMAHALGLQVVAEGVEDHAAYDLLAGAGCDTVQGYYVSRPLPVAELARWMDGLAVSDQPSTVSDQPSTVSDQLTTSPARYVPIQDISNTASSEL